ncbi:MAG: hypothetical protein ACKJSK_18110 [Roseibacillus sp.]
MNHPSPPRAVVVTGAAYYTSGLAGNAGSGYVVGRVGVSSSF